MTLQIARTGHFGDIVRTALFGLVGIAAVVGFGAKGVDFPLAVLTISSAVFGAIGGATALDDVSVLRDDMDDATARSAYGKQAKARNLALLKKMTGGLLGVSGIALLIAIFTG